MRVTKPVIMVLDPVRGRTVLELASSLING